MNPDLALILKHLGAAAAGRVLLLLTVPRGPVSLVSVLRVLVWEVPLIAAFAFVGHFSGRAADMSEATTIVMTALIAHFGARGVDAVARRFLPERPSP